MVGFHLYHPKMSDVTGKKLRDVRDEGRGREGKGRSVRLEQPFSISRTSLGRSCAETPGCHSCLKDSVVCDLGEVVWLDSKRVDRGMFSSPSPWLFLLPLSS